MSVSVLVAWQMLSGYVASLREDLSRAGGSAAGRSDVEVELRSRVSELAQ